MSSPPIRFCFGVHLHQPVGNFGSVFEQHMTDVYLPFLQRARDAEFLPLTLHISGPLLEWMEANDSRYIDLVGELASAGKLELLLAGMYEPVLVSLPREDRLQQVQWMREALHARFGVDARGLWLTERVWESELAADLHDAGVRYALVDDRHFVVSGIDRERLHAPYWTESGGKRLALFPIDERLRYLIPFQPAEDTVAYLRGLRAAGQRLAVLADDGEKFGGWPGTKDWVYTRGWLERFFTALRAPIEAGEVQLSTFADALDNVPSGGLAYLGTASYREMEAWSLPPERAARLEALEAKLGADRMAGPDGALVRGSHWRNFLVKYPESNRMHKKMLALSARCREVPSATEARRAVARAQCNDAYWHGVFGGLYLPHLRDAIWRNLAHAEKLLRSGESLTAEVLDFDADGHEEIWIHSAKFSAVVSPWRGGAIEEWTLFDAEINVANTLTRRREAYHKVEVTGVHATPNKEKDSAPSIHDIESGVRLDVLPPVDLDDRAICVDRLVSNGTTRQEFVDATYVPERSWARAPMSYTIEHGEDSVTVVMHDAERALEKRLTFTADGALQADWNWEQGIGASDAWFTTEISTSRPLEIQVGEGAQSWSYEIETVAMSERGLDRTKQGTAEVRAWPSAAGTAPRRMPTCPRCPLPATRCPRQVSDHFVVFVCPLLSENASRMIVAAAGLTGVRLGVITHDPMENAPEWARSSISAHWRVNSILDPEQLVVAAQGLAQMTGARVHRLFGAYEQAQEPIAIARERLGLPGMSGEKTRNFRDKARMKDVLRAAGIPCARHALATSVDHAVREAARIGYPLVIKPPAGAGAISTFRVERESELRAALALAPPSREHPALLEEFVLGEEHSLETISIGGKAVWHSLTRYAPTPLDVVRNPWIQWCVLLPRETGAPEYDDIKAAAAGALQALGMETGLSHMEWFRRPDGSIAIGEVGARPPGAQITTMVSRANDIDFLAAWARAVIFDEFTRPVQKYAVGTAFLRGQGSGSVRNVRGIEKAAQEVAPLVCDYKLPHAGQVPTGSYEGEGFIMVRHPETAVVERALTRIVSLVRVELD